MKVAVLGVGQVSSEMLEAAAQGSERVFPDTECFVLEESLGIPKQAYDRRRSQYNSTLILGELYSYTADQDFDRVLGVVDVDIFSSGLSFVFGEAYAPGRAGLISLWRLRPQFYGEVNFGIFIHRAIKEAIHELGHTLGLQHCPRSYCVMHFSNSIFEVDKKQSLFCDQCYLTAAEAINNIGHQT